MTKFEVLMTQAKFSNRLDAQIDKRKVDAPKGICRFMFIEILFRIAKFMYSTHEQATQAEVHEMKLRDDSTETVKVAQSFYMLMKEKIHPFYEAKAIG